MKTTNLHSSEASLYERVTGNGYVLVYGKSVYVLTRENGKLIAVKQKKVSENTVKSLAARKVYKKVKGPLKRVLLREALKVLTPQSI